MNEPGRIMKTFIIGDIHGCSREFSALLEILNPDPEADRLILLGDLFDRGPDSWGVLQKVQTLPLTFGDRFTLLKGNHEDYLLSEKLNFFQKRMWDRVGRPATVRSFREHGEQMEDAAPWLRENCRTFYRDEHVQCVHAGLRVAPIELNDEQTLIHDHHVVMENSYTGPLTVTGHIALDWPVWFGGDGETTEMLPYGEQRPLPDHGVICIDTGCGKGGPLTAMVLEGKTYRLERSGIPGMNEG